MYELIIVSALAILALLVATITAFSISRLPAGTDKVQEISAAIRVGAMAFLKREYQVISIFVVIVAGLLGFFISWYTAIAFVFGAFLSALAGLIGMRTATNANCRAATAVSKSLDAGLRISFRAGTVMGLTIMGLGLLGIVLVTWLFGLAGQSMEEVLVILFGFGFGASSIGLFMRVGGGIYTKAADVGADLVGKVEAGIPEDDPRNPAVIADNVGDNVGDVTGMGADLFESFVGSLVAAMAIGFTKFGMAGVYFPLTLAAAGIVASLLASFVVRGNTVQKAQAALRNVILISSLLALVASAALSWHFFQSFNAFYAAATGIIAGILVGVITEYYTSSKYSPTQKIAEAAQTGAGTNLIEGLAVGMQSAILPGLVIVAALLISVWTAGPYGITLAAVGMLATVAITMAIDTYGAVADNAGGIAEMAGLPPNVRKRTDALDTLGNTTAAIGKGFSIAASAFVALALFSDFTVLANLGATSITNPYVIAGLLIGAMVPFLFSSFCMRAVSRAAFVIIEEVRRQFRTKKILEGKDKPDYGACVDIATRGALREMIAPGLLVVVTPVVVGFLLGPAALAGMLLGATATGVLLALMMANAGGAWDNAKKYIESGKYGGKGSAAHKAAVVGDTVGDPFKDTAGGSLNILVKLMGIVAILILPLLLV